MNEKFKRTIFNILCFFTGAVAFICLGIYIERTHFRIQQDAATYTEPRAIVYAPPPREEAPEPFVPLEITPLPPTTYEPPTYQAPKLQPVYSRTLFAPNGTVWPSAAGYVRETAQLNNDGLSSVTIDSAQQDSDVHVKLKEIGKYDQTTVREVFIPARSSFTIENINAGNYNIEYKDLDSGSCYKAEPFRLKQIEEDGGVRYSKVQMTLYKIVGGNMETTAIPAEQF